MHRITLTAAALLAGLVLTGCAGTSTSPPDVATPRPGATPSPASPSPTTAPDPITVDLTPGGNAAELGDGWRIQHCEGDAPLLCVHDADGTVRGLVEMNAHATPDELVRAQAEGDVVPALEAMVAAQHASVATDRVRGCGQQYTYRAEPAVHGTVGGEPAVVYAFSGFVDGEEVERHRAWYTVQSGQLWTINAAASSPGSCMADAELTEFSPADLAFVTPWLDRVVAGSRVPVDGDT